MKLPSGEYFIVKKWIQIIGSFFLLTAYCLLLTVFLSACGRRGDPVLVTPSDTREDEVKSEAPAIKETGTEAREAMGEAETGAVQPEPPTGLIALFTGKSVVITWDEIIGQGVRLYRVYRSEGNEFNVIGEAVTPAFADRNVKPNVKYMYSISSVGMSEGPRSETVEVVTEGE
jgi:hypothetical protein